MQALIGTWLLFLYIVPLGVLAFLAAIAVYQWHVKH